MKPSSTSAARWMFVTRGSPGLYGVVKEPTSSVIRSLRASAVANAGLMSAIRTGICRIAGFCSSAWRTVSASTSRPADDVDDVDAAVGADGEPRVLRLSSPPRRTAGAGSARIDGRVSFSRTSPPSATNSSAFASASLADRVAVPEQHHLRAPCRAASSRRPARAAADCVVGGRLHAPQRQLETGRRGAAAAAARAITARAVDQDPALAAHDPQACPSPTPSRRACTGGTSTALPGRSQRARERPPRPSGSAGRARAGRATPSRSRTRSRKPDVARPAQRVGRVGRDLDLAQRHRGTLRAGRQHHALRDDRPRRRRQQLGRGGVARRPPTATPPTRTSGGSSPSYGRPSSGDRAARARSARAPPTTIRRRRNSRGRPADPISAQGSVPRAQPQPHPSAGAACRPRRQPTPSSAAPAERARARRAG